MFFKPFNVRRIKMLEDKIIGFAENGYYKITANGTWAQNVPEFSGGECDAVFRRGITRL